MAKRFLSVMGRKATRYVTGSTSVGSFGFEARQSIDGHLGGTLSSHLQEMAIHVVG